MMLTGGKQIASSGMHAPEQRDHAYVICMQVSAARRPADELNSFHLCWVWPPAIDDSAMQERLPGWHALHMALHGTCCLRYD